MALQELDGYEEDYVFLSDIENDDYAPRIEPTKAPSIHSTTSHWHQQRTRPAQSSGLEADHDEDSDLEDIEEIEYGYDNDTLLIMPAMLRDYSHHATNYHPELWRAPHPDRRSPQPSSARCRQEDRILDRAELLKNSVPPTTCGICFETFTVFDLEPQPQQGTTEHDEVSPRAQFARSFTARLARSFVLGSSSSGSENVHTSSTPGESTSSTSATSTAPLASAPINASRVPIAAMHATTPSISSRDIGIVMPCDHGLCLSCLQSFLTNAATQNQARFPTLCPQPGCRTPIPTESAELVLDPETLEIWYRKLAEIYVANKVYCPRPECRSIIDLDDRDGTAVTCPECKSSFCAACAVPFHRGLSCEQYQTQSQGGESEEDRAMLQLVRDRHWRHCPSCRFVIEKQQGCNHMVCHCGQSFCYKCGQPWSEMDARCSQDCESRGAHEDFGLDCNIM